MSTATYDFGFTDSKLRAGWYALLAVMLVVGLYGLYFRLTQGLLETNLSVVVPWGTWVAFYIYFVGLSAGAFLVSAMVSVLGMDKYHPIERDALLVAILSMVLALMFIQADLGRMERAFYPLIHRQPMSVLSWEVHAYTLYILVLMGELYFSMRKDLVKTAQEASGLRAKVSSILTLGRTDTDPETLESDKKWLRRLGLLGVPLAIFFVHGGTGMLFASNASVPYWHGGILPAIFVVSAVVSGLALVMAIYVLRSKAFGDDLDTSILGSLSLLLIAFILVDIMLKAFDTLMGLYGMDPAKVDAWYFIVFGDVNWAFYLMTIFAWLIPLALLSRHKWRRSPTNTLLAGISVVFGVIGTRFVIVVPGLFVPDYSGLPIGQYTGTMEEWALAVGYIAFGALIYTVGAELLPLRPLDGGDH